MNEALKTALLAAGVSPENITKLEEQELNEVSDFANLEVKDLVAAGIKLGPANKIFGVVKYNTPPPAPPLQTAAPVVAAASPVALQAPAAAAPPVVVAQAPVALPPAPAPAAPMGGGMSDLLSILPPRTPQAAAERLCRAPSDAEAQSYWRQFFGDATLIYSITPGVIDYAKTMEAVEFWVTEQEAPKEMDNQPLLSINGFLEQIFSCCPFTGERLMSGGKSYKSGVHYGFIVGSDISLTGVQSNPGMLFLAFAVETGKIAKPDDVNTWKSRLIEFRTQVEGKDISTPQAIKQAVSGSAWDDVATDYILDTHNGRPIAQRAMVRLITKAKRRTARTQLAGIGSGSGRGEDI